MMHYKRTDPDLTGFAALLGDSFRSKIDLLTKIVQQHHYASIGRYKERLLAKTIAEYIPRNFEVGTGFVLFAHSATEERAAKLGFDKWNMGSYSISKECDILVFDSSKIPVVFRDDDFVVVRPESVKAVIEVKGSISHGEVAKALNNFLDFGQKWRRCQQFYLKDERPLSRTPSLCVMCWDVAKDDRGKPKTNGQRITKQIAAFYRSRLTNLDELDGFPTISRLFLYNQCEVSETVVITDKFSHGYQWHEGQFLRAESSGVVSYEGDRTIASLLATLHVAICEEVSSDLNRFFSYADEVKKDLSAAEFAERFAGWIDVPAGSSIGEYVIDRSKEIQATESINRAVTP